MPPRRIKKDRQENWIETDDGRLVNPNSNEGMVLSGIVKPAPEVKPYSEDLIPANAAAAIKALPCDENGLLLYKKLPGDCEVYKMHMADDTNPDALPMPGIVCDADDLTKVLQSIVGDAEGPRYKNPKSGLEFEWTEPPPGFYQSKPGWDIPKQVSDQESEKE
mmetsp:Transcript_2905/g.4053  ORF Transcript_2905/g.4053 Transcript_2905/m.4053 type:complete len:163 (+) Transcript_2905:11-499(+)